MTCFITQYVGAFDMLYLAMDGSTTENMMHARIFTNLGAAYSHMLTLPDSRRWHVSVV